MPVLSLSETKFRCERPLPPLGTLTVDVCFLKLPPTVQGTNLHLTGGWYRATQLVVSSTSACVIHHLRCAHERRSGPGCPRCR